MDRRRFLGWLGAPALAAIAGCNGDGETATTEGGRASEDPTTGAGTPTGTPTRTARATETPSAKPTPAGEASTARSLSTDEWPAVGFDAANTRHCPAGHAPGGSPSPRWSFENERAIHYPPVVAEGTVLVQSGEAFRLVALDADSGEEKWTATQATGAPVVSDGTAYVPQSETRGPILVALDLETGEEDWRYDGGKARVQGSVCTLSAGVLVIPTRERDSVSEDHTAFVHGVDVETGEQLWRVRSVRNFRRFEPAVADGRVFLGGEQLAAHDLAAGEKLWEYAASEDWELQHHPVAVGDTVLAGQFPLRALDAATGDPVWETIPEMEVGAAPAVDGERAYVPTRIKGEGLVAVDLETGSTEWSSPVREGSDPARLTVGPAVAGDTVVAGTTGGGDSNRVVALGTGDGSERWAIETGQRLLHAPSLAGGHAYVVVDGPDRRSHLLLALSTES